MRAAPFSARRLLQLAIPWGLVAALACGGAEPRRPNLLLVTVDTLRADRLGCYGGDRGVGRAICALGDEGWRFVWAFATAPSTAPSIASILTSRWPRDHGVRQDFGTTLHDDAVSVAEVLRDAGYDTAAFVSNPVLKRQRNLGQGFAIYDDQTTSRERNRLHAFERRARRTTDAALAWAKVAEEPWFLWVHFQDPHGPYDAPHFPTPRDHPDARPLPVLDDHSGRGGIPAYQALRGVYTAEAYAQSYVGELLFLDRHVAELIEFLDGLGTRPGVLLTADHGEAFGEDDYWFAHGHSVGLDQIRVPLVWRPPDPGPAAGGAASGASVGRPVSTVDVAPTLLAAAGLAAPDAFEGVALPPSDASRTLFAEHEHRVALVADRDYYARDRDSLHGEVVDAVSGGILTPLPPRSARVPDDAALPGYDEGEDPSLDLVLDTFVGDAPPDDLDPAAMPPAVREQLRALGYLQ